MASSSCAGVLRGLGIRSISQHSITFKVHKQSAEISIYHGRIAAPGVGASVRQNITEFSFKSERRMRMVLEDNVDHFECYACCTYPSDFPLDGITVKRQTMAMKKRLRRAGVKDYFWGLEFQERGAPHINWLLPLGVDPDKFAQDWYEIVGSGDPNHLIYGGVLEPIRDKSKMRTYILGYQRKKEQHEVPEGFQNVGRWWGCSLKPRESGRYTYQFDTAEAAEAFIKPVIAFQEARLKEWSEKSGKEYKWGNKGNSFTLWGGAEIINKFLVGDMTEIFLQLQRSYQEEEENYDL